MIKPVSTPYDNARPEILQHGAYAYTYANFKFVYSVRCSIVSMSKQLLSIFIKYVML